MRRILVNEFASSWRRRWNDERPSEVLPEVAGGDLGDLSDAVAGRSTLVAALALLPRRQRAVVVLRFFHDYSEAMTAEALGVTVGRSSPRPPRPWPPCGRSRPADRAAPSPSPAPANEQPGRANPGRLARRPGGGRWTTAVAPSPRTTTSTGTASAGPRPPAAVAAAWPRSTRVAVARRRWGAGLTRAPEHRSGGPARRPHRDRQLFATYQDGLHGSSACTTYRSRGWPPHRRRLAAFPAWPATSAEVQCPDVPGPGRRCVGDALDLPARDRSPIPQGGLSRLTPRGARPRARR